MYFPHTKHFSEKMSSSECAKSATHAGYLFVLMLESQFHFNFHLFHYISYKTPLIGNQNIYPNFSLPSISFQNMLQYLCQPHAWHISGSEIKALIFFHFISSPLSDFHS